MAIDPNSVAWTQRYQAARMACGQSVGEEIADVASDICDPVVKLRFLRDVIDNQHRIPRSFKYIVVQRLRRRWLRIKAVISKTAHSTRHRFRSFLKVALLIGATCTATVFAAYTYNPNARLAAPAPVAAAPITESKPAQIELPPIAETLPADTLGVTPTTIWLADHGANWELYSNGLRIETIYTVAGEPRRYRVHDRSHGVQEAVQTKPVGILFHTSESDVWPLDTGYEKQLRQSSAALLSYVKAQRAYNYVIDRFGRVYRVVDDETRANHAGHGVWAHGDDVYLDLNSAFLGVSFETRWEGGRALPITRAQLTAGRNLTHFLRQRFAIAPEMCVTHGLTSVAPKQHLIGYHIDWARGFPFAAFGLPDQYAVPPPSIALFGFAYSENLAQAVGEGWPGLTAADASLARDATAEQVTVEALRAKRQALFSKWAAEARVNDSRADSRTSPPDTYSAAQSPDSVDIPPPIANVETTQAGNGAASNHPITAKRG